MSRQPATRASPFWRRALVFIAGAFALGLLLFLLLWWRDRGNDFYRPGPAPQTAEGQQFKPLPVPLPAGEAGDNASGMGRPDQIIANAPRSERPAPAPAPRPAPPEVTATATSAPVPISSPPPRYPREALRNGESGTVLLRVHVGPDGVPFQVDLAQSSRSRALDRAASETVRRWRFRPAQQDGRPVAGVVQVPIAFNVGG